MLGAAHSNEQSRVPYDYQHRNQNQCIRFVFWVTFAVKLVPKYTNASHTEYHDFDESVPVILVAKFHTWAMRPSLVSPQ